VTTCDRLGYLRRYLPHFAEFCRRDPRFSLLVALDGQDPAYVDFCEVWQVPLVYSERPEGVGLSKNRVLTRFPDFDYYFFLDDDVELVDGSAFPTHVALSRESGIHHFSLFERGGVRDPSGESLISGQRVVHGAYGGGQLSFFSREGLQAVGGWHPRFAEYRRWGHTEHSHRFPRVGLAPAPFNVAEDLSDAFIWHYPPAVSPMNVLERDDDQLVSPERELMEQELTHVPIETMAAHHFNGVAFGRVGRLADTLAGAERYPLVEGPERRRCWSDFHLWRAKQGTGPLHRLMSYVKAVATWPRNPMIRHRVKELLGW
jgi:hypothetical protein